MGSRIMPGAYSTTVAIIASIGRSGDITLRAKVVCAATYTPICGPLVRSPTLASAPENGQEVSLAWSTSANALPRSRTAPSLGTSTCFRDGCDTSDFVEIGTGERQNDPDRPMELMVDVFGR